MIEPSLPPSADAEIRSLLRDRRKIEAIKVLRQHTGLGLKEAKDKVEAIERDLGLPPAGATGAGPVGAAVIIILGILAWWWLKG
jgi:hypothetical protein